MIEQESPTCIIDNVLYANIILRNDTKDQWELYNPTLKKGEAGVEWSDSGNNIKIGDGTTSWADLPYFIQQAQGEGIQGIKINGIDITPDSQKKVNIPPASDNAYGVIKTDPLTGISATNGVLTINAEKLKEKIGLEKAINKTEEELKLDFTGSIISGNTGFITGNQIVEALENYRTSDEQDVIDDTKYSPDNEPPYPVKKVEVGAGLQITGESDTPVIDLNTETLFVLNCGSSV